MNKVILMGRLTKDPEIRSTQDGKTIARFSLAVDRRFKREGEAEADFFNCTAFGKTAEFAEKYVTKGTKILLTGRLQNDEWTNREGKKVTSTGIIVDELEFAESKTAKTEKAFTDKPKDTEWMPTDDLAEDELPFKF